LPGATLPAPANAPGYPPLVVVSDISLTTSPSTSQVTRGANLTYTFAVTNKGPANSDGDVLTTSLPGGTTYVGYTITSGSCAHPAVGATGAVTCTRPASLLPAHSWGPIKLTVKVNAASGSTLTNSAFVASRTQDIVPDNNRATVYVKVR
jgi:uncharacterized repeat protein (TIGR01451 family)